MRLVSIQVGKPITLGQAEAADPEDRVWTTGFFKTPVTGSVYVGKTNLAGDGQADLKNHGGVDKAICAYSKDHWAYWEAEFGLHLANGAFGENFTIEGATEPDICIGDIYRCGGAVLQVSQPRQPCWKLARRWRLKDLPARIEQTGRTGWYFRVLEEGTIEAPAEIALLERLRPEWTLQAANEVMHHKKQDWQAAQSLASVPELSASWRASLSQRATTQTVAPDHRRLTGS